jgi:cysteine-S-conjugate beta-lyase
MPYDFTQDLDRRNTFSAKWDVHPPDVLPMWVADMEFGVPSFIAEAVRERLEHPIYGYQIDYPPLREVIAERMMTRYQWQVDPNWIGLLPGLVLGLNLVSASVGEAGTGNLILTPIYPPFYAASQNFGREMHTAELVPIVEGNLLRYEIDFDALEAAIQPSTRLMMLCNPHNPVGRAYTRAELERLAELALRHDLIICSDEIHSDLIYSGHTHTPIAALAPEIAARTITLVSPSKTFNMPGLACAAAIVPNDEIMQRLRKMSYMMGALVSVVAPRAADAAYRHGNAWLADLLIQLEANRETIISYVSEHFPTMRVTRPEATYLTWLDCRALNLEPDPFHFFLERGKVAFNNGHEFGAGGAGFVRINYACSPAMLMDGLERMRRAING